MYFNFYIVVLINSDEYTMISIYNYFGNLKISNVISSSSLLHDHMFAATLWELRNINRCKHGFNVNTTYQTN